MGNYQVIELEFIDRTLRLINQYHKSLNNYSFEEQFNFTLMINCLLGLIVMPKEKVISCIPTNRLTKSYLAKIGAPSLELGENISTLRELIRALRNSIAHFDITVISENDENRIDLLEFSDSENGESLVARFRATELQSFLNYYGNCLLTNIQRRQNGQ